MPTDSFQIAWAGPIAWGSQGVSGQEMDASNLVDVIASTLKAGGWSEVEKVYARQVLRMYGPLTPITGEPLPPEEKTPASCDPAMLHHGDGCSGRTGRVLQGYDPGRYFPPPCDSFTLGGSPAATVANFIGAITGHTPANAYLSPGVTERYGDYGVGLVAKTPGTGMNGYCFHGDPWGTWSFTGPLWGGGFRLRSQTYNSTYIELMVTAREGSFGPSVRLDWAVNSSIVPPDDAWPPNSAWPVAAGQEMSTLNTSNPHTYSIWACPYQMAIWARDVDGDTSAGAGTTACFASIPRVPVEHSGFSQAIILPQYYRSIGLFGGNMRTSLTYAPAAVSVGSAIHVGDNIAGIAGFRLPDHPLLTSEGDPILQNPYVWTRHYQQGIIGQLWNCTLLSSHEYSRDSQMMWDRRRYVCMSRQTPYLGRAVGGLWLALPDSAPGE